MIQAEKKQLKNESIGVNFPMKVYDVRDLQSYSNKKKKHLGILRLYLVIAK